MMAYKGVGQTLYQVPKEKPTVKHVEPAIIEAPLIKKPGRRPTPLIFKPAVPALNADSIYLTQLAHYPENMESKGVEKIIAAIKTDPCKVHIVNLCSATAISRIQKAREERVEITCETCPHFLYFTDQSVADGDTRLKNFPPIRNKANCNFLWELVKMNSVDAICSQHVPVPEQYKFKPNFRKALCGIAGLGFTLQVLWTILKSPYTDLSLFEHYLVRLAKWTSSNPARILQIPNRGAIEKGFLADLVIWDPFREVTVEQTHSSQGNQCPYLGARLYGQIEKVIVRGKLAYSNKVFYPVGRAVKREDTTSSTRATI
jgi:allantoinase